MSYRAYLSSSSSGTDVACHIAVNSVNDASTLREFRAGDVFHPVRVIPTLSTASENSQISANVQQAAFRKPATFPQACEQTGSDRKWCVGEASLLTVTLIPLIPAAERRRGTRNSSIPKSQGTRTALRRTQVYKVQ
ncbi:uncharacterized [Tachysurus ichikawai]